MKFLLAAVLFSALASPPCVASTEEARLTTVEELRNMQCAPIKSARVTAYLHSSRHGAWLSSGPGTNDVKGMPLELSESIDQTENKKFFQYLFAPKIYLNNLFKADFTGYISCNLRGVPVIHVERVDSIQVTPVKDASDT